MNVIVIGAGWAGLAAAVELARQGATVTVLESARQLGGRARGLPFNTYRLDNGQHLLLGAYRTVLGLLKTIGVREKQVFARSPLNLTLLGPDGVVFSLNTPCLPAPLHTGWALLRASGLNLLEKHAAARVIAAARQGINRDIPLLRLLRALGQRATAIDKLWEPLCLAALNTPASHASGQLFLNVLRASFLAPRAASDMLLPIKDLGRCLPEPARDYIEKQGGSVRLGERVKGLVLGGDRVTGVFTNRDEFTADEVVIATAPRAAQELMRPHEVLSGMAGQIEKLGSAPICTLYVRYPLPVRLPKPFVGLAGGSVQWLFDHGQLKGDHGLMAAVISGPGRHMRLDTAELVAQMVSDIARQFPTWPEPIETKLVREKQATFLATAGCELHRPTNTTVLQNLWLAGDYTDTGFPGTLEGAAMSGVQCARLILEDNSRHERLSPAS